MWKGLSIATDSPSPIVVVLSGSMEPAFQRGDLLFLWNRNIFAETEVGEVVVYNVKDKDIPIVHRVVRKFGTGYVFFLFLLLPPVSCTFPVLMGDL
jgi:signal peptidase